MTERELDEYKPVKFYAENTKAKQAGFSKFVVDKDFYFCRYIDGDIAMISQAYVSESGRDNGIESVKKNEKIAKRYKFESRGAKDHGFALKAGNGQEIAISPSYASLAKAEHVSGRLTGKTKAKVKAVKAAAPKKAPAKAKAKPAKSTPRVAKAATAKAKPTSSNNEQNYLPLAAYRKATKGKVEGFEKFQGKDGEYYFTYFEDSKLALISEGYPTAAIRDKGLASVEKNMKIEKRYVYGKGADGRDGFILRAGNHKEIARSVNYGSAAAAAAGAAYLIGTRRRTKAKAAGSVAVAGLAVGAAAAKPTAVKKAAVPVKAAKVKPAPKPVVKKTKPIAPLAAGGVAVAGLAAAAAAAKSTPVKKAAVPVKAPPIKAAPVVKAAAAVVAAPVAVAAAAAVAAAPKAAPPAPAAPKVTPPVAAKAAPIPAAAEVAGGKGIWGWLKWLLLGLLLLLALFLFKSCLGGEKTVKAAPATTTTTSAAPAALVSCWNGSKAKSDAECPAKVTCYDNSFATSLSECPVRPAAKEFVCWDGSRSANEAECPVKPAPAAKVVTPAESVKMTAPSVDSRICGPSSNRLFNVNRAVPKSVSFLGSNPEFGNSLSLTPEGFYKKLALAHRTYANDRNFLNTLARSLGYGSFDDMDASMFSHDTLANGTSGLLGFGSQHSVQYSTLNVTDPTHLEAFRVRAANGTDVHFMKRCGNYMYVCQP